ncbi:AGL290Cp [Eremothecium gossypii ATCC 10895]|uniref:AGL290Cp n=1 Tax=Eremothecium gossypii (strain ATCC 10895 / CBS 109.51 / FGSC 9923 / NRRL Y-1056) TaxID=284811 RepID=Q751J6_EREGS|nr:AGL290Cp [Eremothecium gossypii ATCC 10895]AAS54201.1 AGL290Cp [Eremothecium gossypii ATCC 10895]AEY98527.1 FAGL290Cp [Eremothecium gossypii FDAG1]
MSDNKSRRKPFYNNHVRRSRAIGCSAVASAAGVVMRSASQQVYGTETAEALCSNTKLTKRLLDFHLKRGRWKSKKRRPLKIEDFLDNGLKHIRSGIYAGSQDDRPIRCSMRGIKHLYYVSPRVLCMCRWCSLRPSPLRSEITTYSDDESMYLQLLGRWNAGYFQYCGDEVYGRQHNSLIRML